MSLLLEGKRAFITGGTRGIGAALCEVFAREGADVAFNYNERDDLAEQTKGRIKAHNRRALAFKISVTDRVALKKMTRELVEEWGGIEILVNNAAINRGDNFATTTDRAWDEVINTNVNGLFAVTKPIYKQMIRQRKGAILNITSIGAIRALPTSVHYATSKAAVIGFTKCLSREAATFGIAAGFGKIISRRKCITIAGTLFFVLCAIVVVVVVLITTSRLVQKQEIMSNNETTCKRQGQISLHFVN